jgi:hypothetical protein
MKDMLLLSTALLYSRMNETDSKRTKTSGILVMSDRNSTLKATWTLVEGMWVMGSFFPLRTQHEGMELTGRLLMGNRR